MKQADWIGADLVSRTVQAVVQKGSGRQDGGLEVPQSAAHECFMLGARGFPFCNRKVLSDDGRAESGA